MPGNLFCCVLLKKCINGILFAVKECDGGVNKKQGGREGPKEEESLHSLELSPEMKKKLMDEIKAPVSEKKTRKIPWTILEHIKCFLQANEAGIWVSRFLVQYKVIKTLIVIV